MKQIVKIFIAAAVALFAAEATADAQILKNLLNKAKGSDTTETVSQATSNGQAAGAALRSLYTQYKSDGKLDMTNLNNMLNLATLSTNIKGLKGATDKSTFYKDFAKGLISGSNNLVNNNNSSAVMTGLSTLVNDVDLSGLTTAAESAASNAASTVSSAITNALSGAGEKATTAVSNASEIASSVSSILKLFK